ncbi:hypothetical protein S40285_10689 [Stachybotrys chlorohalonatus IBT 40285]|uniref:Uncharacterized protein n=1 Tax=Stachybotrys chlorohalonatus (strain IBT 40285) TaxID=1283841 RepID=A0A084QYH0_STAC4|nr:hypothetical protein S40285_10689 [Stachybotrys chlorohalonata IBT 40285]
MSLPWIPVPSLPVTDSAALDRLTGFMGDAGDGMPLTPDPDAIRTFLQTTSSSLSKSGRELGLDPLESLLVFVDPDSGSSLLHAVVAAGNLDGLLGIQRSFSPSVRSGELRPIHVFYTHQNKIGDTAMHVAVRTGRLDMVKNLYRLFCNRPLEIDEHRAPLEGKDGPENWVVPDHLWHLARKPLLFLLIKNAAGRDAAQEARYSGYEEIAVFLERIIKGLDPRGKRFDEDEVKRMERKIRRGFAFLNSDGVKDPDSEAE